MTTVLVVAAVFGLALGFAFFRIFRKLAAPARNYRTSSDSIREWSGDRYRPMARLLDDADFAFLASHPGYHPDMRKRLRCERRKAFRGYLRSLERDFSRISGAIQSLMTHSQVDRPDLAAILVKQRARFTYGVLAIEFSLALDAMGYHAVSVQPLLDTLQSMRGELQQLLPSAAPSLA